MKRSRAHDAGLHAAEGRRWTGAELAALRRAYPIGGARAVRALVPRHPDSAIYAKVRQLRLPPRCRRWTADDLERLQAQWGLESIASIMAWSGRHRAGIYLKARELGLPVGCPPGWQYVSSAAARAGYSLEWFLAIMRWAKVRVTRAYSRHRSRRHQRIVPGDEARQAVVRFVRTETVEHAARRHGVCAQTMVALCARAHVKLWARSSLRGSPQRADAGEFDRAMAEHMAYLLATESMADAAARIGVSHTTMTVWLRRHGDPRTWREERLARDFVDRLVAIELARHGCRARPERYRRVRPARTKMPHIRRAA